MASYLSVEIYRSGSDCTNNGVSSPANAAGKIFLVECPNGNWNDDDIANNPSRFVVLKIASAGNENHLRPVSAGSRWTMFGGNFAWSSDSRWRKIAPAPLRIHDRIEG